MSVRRSFPSGKVRINGELNRSNLYYENRSKLGLLPKLFLYLLLFILIALPFWYFNILDVRAFLQPSDKQASTNSPFKLVHNLDQSEPQVELITLDQKELPSNQDLTLLTDKTGGAKCYLSYSDTQNEVAPLINKEAEGWWLPTDCEEKALQAIQIIRLDDKEAHQVARKINLTNLQNLDGKNLYAIVYAQGDRTVSYRLARYIQSLALPVFNDLDQFDPTAALETKRVDNFTYYLNGKCHGKASTCNLWRVESDTGTVELLKENVGQTKAGEENELNDNLVLRFATKQDYAEGVNLILLDRKNSIYKLLRVNQEQWQVYETLEIARSDSLYSVYYL